LQAIGIFGGTFDPIHFGHLRLAEEMDDALHQSQVRFIPAGQPPHREAPRTAAVHRCEMVRRAIADNPRFVLDAREVAQSAPSYTVATLESLRAELGEAQPLVLLLGADAFIGLPGWHRWQSLFSLAQIAVASRPDAQLTRNTLAEPLRSTLQNLPAPEAVRFLEMTPLAISASAIRAQRMQGRSARYLLPEAVRAYIDEHQLYFTP
jgi:nicotinate-nucleotide adenylyltransferase